MEVSYDSGISGCGASLCSASASFFESTPNDADSSHKRKFVPKELIRRLDVTEPFSSTLNDSLIGTLENCQIVSHATPEKERQFSSYFIPKIVDSPQKEAHEILYGSLRSSGRKAYSPRKYHPYEITSPAKKRLFEQKERRSADLFCKVISTPVIMSVLFPYLSDGDVYRASLTHPLFKRAIGQNVNARTRYEIFLERHKRNKENYRITPPGSPEKASPPGSPISQNFKDFFQVAQLLNRGQKLTKCLKCGKPSIVENAVAQCQNATACGYVSCLKCLSGSDGPENFYDRCRSSALARPLFGDLSNGPVARKSQPKRRAKSSPFAQFNIRDGAAKRPVATVQRLSVVPVIPIESNRTVDHDPPSPEPKIVVGSRRSKQNLKRLTR